MIKVTRQIKYDEKSIWLGSQRLQIVSGAFHYFRVPRSEWEDRLLKCKQGGLNTIETIVPWNIHEYQENQFNFEGNRDLGAFLDLCGELGFYTIVRPSPYICGEWDNGGLPFWLLGKEHVAYRRSNLVYLSYIDHWYDTLMPILMNCQWTQGGSVILVQIENEYGYFDDAQEPSYMIFLRDAMVKRGIEVPLITCDLPGKGFFVPGAVKCANFGSDFRKGLDVLRKEQPNAYLFVSELWLAWFDHWGGEHTTRSGKSVSNALKEVLAAGGHYNFYMWAGGTNFGYYGGRTTTGDYGAFITTSYDYDAPIGETGNVTNKFYECRLVNWLAQTCSEHFANSIEVESSWTASRPEILVTLRQSKQGCSVFLQNTSDIPISFHLSRLDTGQHFPESSTITLDGESTSILLTDYHLTDSTQLLISTCETLAYLPNCQTPTLLVYGDSGAACEMRFCIEGERVSFATDIPRDHTPIHKTVGDIEIIIMNRETSYKTWIDRTGADRWWVDNLYDKPSLQTQLPSLSWDQVDVINELARRVPKVAPTLLPLESFGIYQGYGWYRTTFQHHGGTTNVVFTHVRDRATVFVNGLYQGVIGSFAEFATLSIDTQAGENELLILIDNLGRYCFTSRLGEKKGLWGGVYLNGQSLQLSEWQKTAYSPYQLEMSLSWQIGNGLLLRFTQLSDPCRLFINGHLLHNHRGIGNDDEFAEFDVTPYLRPDGNLLCITSKNPLDKEPIVCAVNYALHHALATPWLVYSGLIGEDTDIHIDPTTFDSLQWSDLDNASGHEAPSFHASVENIDEHLVRTNRPKMYRTTFKLSSASTNTAQVPLKLIPSGLRKGVAWLNGHHLGRYWHVGPQTGLYVPREWLEIKNTLVVFDEDGHHPHSVHFIERETFI